MAFQVERGHAALLTTSNKTLIEEVAVQRLTLRYQDPRMDVRRSVPSAAPVTPQFASEALVTDLLRRAANP